MRFLRRTVALVVLGLAALGCSAEEVTPIALDQAEPVVEENEPVELQILTPKRGTFFEAKDGDQILVKGLGASPGLTINGEPVIPDEYGTFSTTVTARTGLNLIRAVDEDGSLDVPFLFGQYASPSKPVSSAVTVRINSGGFKSTDPKNATLTRLAQLALDDTNLLAQLKGQTYSGTFTGGSWSFKVTSTSYSGSKVSFSPRTGGASFQATVSNVKVNGTLMVKVLFTKTDDATIGLTSANVTGNIDASLSSGGTLGAAGTGVKTTLNGFSYDSDNAGFPCCVDWILTKIMQEQVESAVRDSVRKVLETKVAFALNELGFPASIDLSSSGYPATIGIKQRFDSASFTSSGASLTARVHFTAKVDADDPGKAAPGWFEVGSKPLTVSSSAAFGLTVSIDALNQALHAAWAQGGLERTVDGVPTVGSVKLTPTMPPVVLVTPEGKLYAGIGEVIVDAMLAGKPVKAALTVQDLVTASLDGKAGALTLTTSKQPLISLTWLEASHVVPVVRDTIKKMVIDQAPSMLVPIALPLPSIPLAGIAPSQAKSVAAIAPTSLLSFDADTNRARIQGSLVILPLK
ncbi:MAG: hypothetical protein FJ096_10625 [Deltaproteobacteria bacterium]|nr:hypothetical protein [Deltaproteobacteria bacterium]